MYKQIKAFLNTTTVPILYTHKNWIVRTTTFMTLLSSKQHKRPKGIETYNTHSEITTVSPYPFSGVLPEKRCAWMTFCPSRIAQMQYFSSLKGLYIRSWLMQILNKIQTFIRTSTWQHKSPHTNHTPANKIYVRADTN